MEGEKRRWKSGTGAKGTNVYKDIQVSPSDVNLTSIVISFYKYVIVYNTSTIIETTQKM